MEKSFLVTWGQFSQGYETRIYYHIRILGKGLELVCSGGSCHSSQPHLQASPSPIPRMRRLFIPIIWHSFPRPSPTGTIPNLFILGRERIVQRLSVSLPILSRLKNTEVDSDPTTKCPSNQAGPWHETKGQLQKTDNLTCQILELRYSPLKHRCPSHKMRTCGTLPKLV